MCEKVKEGWYLVVVTFFRPFLKQHNYGKVDFINFS